MKFKIGDSVAVYSHELGRAVGRVVNIQPLKPPWVSVCFDTHTSVVHPKQCRKLVKKERKRIWINLNGCEKQIGFPDATFAPTATFQDYSCNGWIEFVEVKKK